MADPVDVIKIGIVLFVAAIVFGKLEPTMKAQKVAGSTKDMNDTIDAVATNTWAGLNLAVLAVIIVGAVIILRYVGVL